MTNTSDWYFDVFIDENESMIALSTEEFGLDDSLRSSDLDSNIIKALNKAGINGICEMMESIWEVKDKSRSKKDIISSMETQGFIKADLF